MRHLHLDLVGGLSGDMFIGAVLDVHPELGEGLDGVIDEAGFPGLVSLHSESHNDGTLTGTRFSVAAAGEGSHHHRHYSEIRTKLEGSNLAPVTREHALGIFHAIAEVEASIHGKTVESVAFHEVGAWDSIADIVLAAHLITKLDASWSVGPLPLGRGFVDTAHGRLPVPAPATAMLLAGFEVVDDGLEGERITPTGAAILKHLAPVRRLPSGYTLQGTGFGFGSKVFPGIANVARINVFESTLLEQPWDLDQVAQLRFEIDDQTPEQLAQALDGLRQAEGVIDVMQRPVIGKKQRQAASVSVLAVAALVDTVTQRCFELTSTLGIRRELVDRAILRREEVVVHVNERPYRVKVAHRPGGVTAKIEMDDLVASGLNQAEQAEVRHAAERLARKQVGS